MDQMWRKQSEKKRRVIVVATGQEEFYVKRS
jgi:hypothetical protein